MAKLILVGGGTASGKTYVINEVNDKNINVFFGNKDCIKVVSTFDKKLYKLTPEQDFMLGIMLGYDKILQCKRYFVMRDKHNIQK